MKLDDINIEPGIVYETIVTTVNQDNQSNAAAVGVQRIDDKLKMELFEGSNTFKNLKMNDAFGINIIEKDQYGLVVKAALKGWGDDEPEFELSEYDLNDNIPFLKAAKCWIVGKIEMSSIQELTDEYGKTKVMEIVAKVQDLILHDKIDSLLTRSADLPLLEAAILATRYKIASGKLQNDLKIKIENILYSVKGPTVLTNLLFNFLKQCEKN